jgi:hypothetical protein
MKIKCLTCLLGILLTGCASKEFYKTHADTAASTAHKYYLLLQDKDVSNSEYAKRHLKQWLASEVVVLKIISRQHKLTNEQISILNRSEVYLKQKFGTSAEDIIGGTTEKSGTGTNRSANN